MIFPDSCIKPQVLGANSCGSLFTVYGNL